MLTTSCCENQEDRKKFFVVLVLAFWGVSVFGNIEERIEFLGG
jgi:hypothetical protein